MKYLNLIRYKNLIFIAGLQWIIFYTVITPILKVFQIDASTNMLGYQLALLIGSTVFIAAAGYIINDYFDTRIDEINRPEKVIVGKTISKQQASILHYTLTGIGLLMGFSVAYMCRSLTLGLIIAFVPGLLWFYSASYKRQFLLGNIVVAICAGLVPLTISIGCVAFLSKNTLGLIYETPIPITPFIYGSACFFAVFAFISTFIREIIKDMEDEEGDREMECRTIPIVLGINKTKILLYSLIAASILFVLYIYNEYIASFPMFGPEKSSLSIQYFIWGIIIPLLCLAFLIFKAKEASDYHKASTFVKFIMVLGSLYGFIFYFLIAKGLGIAMFDLFIITK